jgi:sarcosine oxidase
MTQIFPQLRGVEVSHRWAGRVAITQDFLPHVHEPAPGISISLGYNGRGIALAITMGKHLAARLTDEGHAFPFPVTSVKPILFHGLQRVHVAAAVSWYRLLDSFK